MILNKFSWENKNIISPMNLCKDLLSMTKMNPEKHIPNMTKLINGSNCLRRINPEKMGGCFIWVDIFDRNCHCRSRMLHSLSSFAQRKTEHTWCSYLFNKFLNRKWITAGVCIFLCLILQFFVLCQTSTIPILMHQMRISTNKVSSVILSPKKLEIQKMWNL
jgi:hypothetical protein